MVLVIFIALLVLFVVLPVFLVSIFFVVKTALVGLVMGALGRLVVPGQQSIGVLATICCGWIGALVGSAIARAASLGTIAGTLVTIGVAAAAVAAWDGAQRRRLGPGRRGVLGR